MILVLSIVSKFNIFKNCNYLLNISEFLASSLQNKISFSVELTCEFNISIYGHVLRIHPLTSGWRTTSRKTDAICRVSVSEIGSRISCVSTSITYRRIRSRVAGVNGISGMRLASLIGAAGGIFELRIDTKLPAKAKISAGSAF